jgi:uncharacterized protein HemX
MLHSSEQVKRDEEEEIARVNREYLDEKRRQLQELKDGTDRMAEQKKASKRRAGKSLCCWFLVIFLALCAYVVYFFFANIKEPLFEDYYQKKSAIEQALPQGKAEVKKGIEQGEQLFGETAGAVEDLNIKIDQAKQTVDGVQKTVEQVKNVVDGIGN